MDKNDIAYFELMKDLPGCPAGSSFTVMQNDDPSIFCGNIKFPIWFASEYPDWFRGVTFDEYHTNFKKSFIFYAMNDRGCNQAEAEQRYQNFMNDSNN